MTLVLRAMQFARSAHADQVRKYTGEPYIKHLAEVAGMVGSLPDEAVWLVGREVAIAVAWLHDVMEDQAVPFDYLARNFGTQVATGVEWLSDMETGTRKERKAASCHRLSLAPAWVKTIKCADLISNTESIVLHDPAFTKVYLNEKTELLDVLKDGAHPALWDLAKSLCHHGLLKVYSGD